MAHNYAALVNAALQGPAQQREEQTLIRQPNCALSLDADAGGLSWSS